MDHFCLLVDSASVDDLIADLRQAGIEMLKGPAKRRDGTALFRIFPQLPSDTIIDTLFLSGVAVPF